MELFNDTSFECSKLITQRYSTSFTLGIRTLDKKFHSPVYAVYGFVRLADEIVDTFHTHDKATLLKNFKASAYQALDERISMNPVLHAFQLTVHEYGIDFAFIEAFLKSMEMDLEGKSYNRDLYDEYIYGSAEVVGLMCLRIFCEGNNSLFEALKEPARSLGAAFQKVNFLRDMKSDFKERGRVYFPTIDFDSFDNAKKQEIENEIREDFNKAYKGILGLPRSSRMGVYLAYVYYLRLFKKIQNLPATCILNERVRVPDQIKFVLLIGSYLKYQLNTI